MTSGSSPRISLDGKQSETGQALRIFEGHTYEVHLGSVVLRTQISQVKGRAVGRQLPSLTLLPSGLPLSIFLTGTCPFASPESGRAWRQPGSNLADNAVLVIHWIRGDGNTFLSKNYTEALFAPGRRWMRATEIQRSLKTEPDRSLLASVRDDRFKQPQICVWV